MPFSILLTFDDGPNPSTTPIILESLARHDIQAVFFVNLLKTENLISAIHKAGHRLGIQSGSKYLETHQNLPAGVIQEWAAQFAAVLPAEELGDHFQWIRGPYGLKPKNDDVYGTLKYLGAHLSLSDRLTMLESPGVGLSQKFSPELLRFLGKSTEQTWTNPDGRLVPIDNGALTSHQLPKDGVTRSAFSKLRVASALELLGRRLAASAKEYPGADVIVLRIRESSALMPCYLDLVVDYLNRLGCRWVKPEDMAGRMISVPPVNPGRETRCSEQEEEDGRYSCFWALASRHLASREGRMASVYIGPEKNETIVKVGIGHRLPQTEPELADLLDSNQLFALPDLATPLPGKGIPSDLRVPKEQGEFIERVMTWRGMSPVTGRAYLNKHGVNLAVEAQWALLRQDVNQVLGGLDKLPVADLTSSWCLGLGIKAEFSPWVRLEALHLPDCLKLLYLDFQFVSRGHFVDDWLLGPLPLEATKGPAKETLWLAFLTLREHCEELGRVWQSPPDEAYEERVRKAAKGLREAETSYQVLLNKGQKRVAQLGLGWRNVVRLGLLDAAAEQAATEVRNAIGSVAGQARILERATAVIENVVIEEPSSPVIRPDPNPEKEIRSNKNNLLQDDGTPDERFLKAHTVIFLVNGLLGNVPSSICVKLQTALDKLENLAVFNLDWDDAYRRRAMLRVKGRRNLSERELLKQITSVIKGEYFGDKNVVLIGHSFGGDSCRELAALLSRHGIPVDLLALLDPINYGGRRVEDEIPGSVKTLYHFVTSSNFFFGLTNFIFDLNDFPQPLPREEANSSDVRTIYDGMLIDYARLPSGEPLRRNGRLVEVNHGGGGINVAIYQDLYIQNILLEAILAIHAHTSPRSFPANGPAGVYWGRRQAVRVFGAYLHFLLIIIDNSDAELLKGIADPWTPRSGYQLCVFGLQNRQVALNNPDHLEALKELQGPTKRFEADFDAHVHRVPEPEGMSLRTFVAQLLEAAKEVDISNQRVWEGYRNPSARWLHSVFRTVGVSEQDLHLITAGNRDWNDWRPHLLFPKPPF